MVKKETNSMERGEIFPLKEKVDGEWASKFTISNYDPGETIFHQGSPFQTYHVLTRGIVKSGTHAPAGQKVLLSIHYPGDLLEVAGAGRKRHKRFARALTKVQVGVIDKEDSKKLLEERPELFYRGIASISKELDFQHKITMAKAVGGTRGSILLLLKECLQRNSAKGNGERIKLSEEDMASLLGVSRETISRHLSVLREKGVARAVRKSVKIIDREQLMELAPDF